MPNMTYKVVASAAGAPERDVPEDSVGGSTSAACVDYCRCAAAEVWPVGASLRVLGRLADSRQGEWREHRAYVVEAGRVRRTDAGASSSKARM